MKYAVLAMLIQSNTEMLGNPGNKKKLANSIIIRIKELLLQLHYIDQTEAFYTGAERINSVKL